MHAGLSITFRLLGDCMKRVLMTDACTRGKTSAVNEDDRTSTVHHVESTDRAAHGQRIAHVSFKCSSSVFCLRPLMAPAGLAVADGHRRLSCQAVIFLRVLCPLSMMIRGTYGTALCTSRRMHNVYRVAPKKASHCQESSLNRIKSRQ